MVKMKYLNIAISGEIGTGKSTLSRNLVKNLGWKYVNLGDFFRKWHEDNNIPLENTTKIPPELDKKIDFGFQDQMAEDSDTVFEARLAGWLAKDLPKVLKVLVVCDFNIAMERAAKREHAPFEEVIKLNQIRSNGHKEKFKKLYGVDDFLDPKYFDLVVDTSHITPEAALEEVLKKLNSQA